MHTSQGRQVQGSICKGPGREEELSEELRSGSGVMRNQSRVEKLGSYF